MATASSSSKTLKEVVSIIEKNVAPLKYAESWDNVGLLVEPSENRQVKKCLLTIDLTEKVMEEAVQVGAELIISYHPPLFAPLKRITSRDVKERIVIKALENKIAIWSPHTVLDAINDGINDWLAKAFPTGTVKPLSNYSDKPDSVKLITYVPKENVDQLREALGKVSGVGRIGNYDFCSFNIPGTGTFFGNDSANPVVGTKGSLEKVEEIRLEMVTPKNKLVDALVALKKNHPYETPAYDIVPLEASPVADIGNGRIVSWSEPISMSEVVDRVKSHLNMDKLRVAIPYKYSQLADVKIKSVAICAGSGKSVFGRTKADLYLTGELDHHYVLQSIEAGTSVICTEHTNCERGYLPHFAKKLEAVFGTDITFLISKSDKDPLSVY